jgi:hypothetical protein
LIFIVDKTSAIRHDTVNCIVRVKPVPRINSFPSQARVLRVLLPVVVVVVVVVVMVMSHDPRRVFSTPGKSVDDPSPPLSTHTPLNPLHHSSPASKTAPTSPTLCRSLSAVLGRVCACARAGGWQVGRKGGIAYVFDAPG